MNIQGVEAMTTEEILRQIEQEGHYQGHGFSSPIPFRSGNRSRG
jgi:hypothetical protein